MKTINVAGASINYDAVKGMNRETFNKTIKGCTNLTAAWEAVQKEKTKAGYKPRS